MDIYEMLSDPGLIDIIIKRIADEVIKRLRNQPKTALVCFSGARIGFDTALKNLERLRVEKGWQFKAMCSDGALKALDLDAIKTALNVDMIHTSQTNTPQRELWEEIDGVIIASATINTVAKLAVGICDTEMLTIINHAIMAGKPIVCAADGACPDNAVRANIGMGKSPEGYRKMLRGNIQALSDFGVDVIAAEDMFDICLDTPAGETPEACDGKGCSVAEPAVKKIAAPVAQTAPATVMPEKPQIAPAPLTKLMLAARNVPQQAAISNAAPVEEKPVLEPDLKENPILTKRIISRVDILNARQNKVIRVSSSSIITDYAKEAAKELGLVIEIV